MYSMAPCAEVVKAARRMREQSNRRIFFLREYEVEIAPVLGGHGALTRPVGIIIQVVRNLGRPETRVVAIVNVPLHRLAKARRPACRIHFPTWRERERAARRDVRARRRLILKGDYILYGIDNALSLLVHCSYVFHFSTSG